MTGEVIEDFCNNGRIWLCGESWQVECDTCLKKGDKVRITGTNGLILTVAKLEEDR
jgi:membrane protein implicated in regulation of membrane protease activity